MPVSTNTQNEFAKAEKEILQEQQLQQKIVNEEYKIWKKTVPLLYDVIHSFALEFPSLVFQWVPEYIEEGDHVQCKFLIGTSSSTQIDNYLKLGSINLPKSLVEPIDITIPNDQTDTSNFQILKQWKQPQSSGASGNEINQLKINKNGDLALSFNSSGLINSYNLVNDDIMDYKYHKQEGYALDWFSSESFLSGANDSQIAYWDISKPSTPIQLFKSHQGSINDLSSLDHRSIFSSVSDDSTTQFHDWRNGTSPIITVENKHIQNCIKFHPTIDTLYVSGGKDNVISLYDIRNYKTPFRKFYGHTDSISQLKWDPLDSNVLYSSAVDKRILIWNLESLDEEFVYPEENNNGKRTNKKEKIDPCLKFLHGGHISRVNSFDVHPRIKNLVASVGGDKLMEIWKVKSLSIEEEEEDEEEQDQEQDQEQEKDQEQEREHDVDQKKDQQEQEESNSNQLEPVDIEMKDQ